MTLIVLSTALALVNVAVMSRTFGVSPAGRDIRNLNELKINLLSARRIPDLVAGVGGDRVIDARVRELFQNERMGAAASKASCVVVRQDGRTILAKNPATPVLPASTMKLILASTLLSELDPAAPFVTQVRAAAPAKDGVLNGDLFFVGGGDPLLATKPYLDTFSRQPQIATSMETLADDIVKAGVKQITGSIVGHDRRYDDQRSVASWKQSYTASGEIGPISALSVNDSFVVTAGARTTRRRAAAARPVWKAAVDPPAEAAAVLTALLTERGVTIVGEARSATAQDSLPTEVIAEIASPPLSEVVGEMLSESDNNTAESLLKELAFQKRGLGTTASGVELEKASLKRRGYPIDDVVLIDGSGLDRANRVTCAILVGAVEESIDTIRDLLPVAGLSGTLSGRMKGDEIKGRVRAKTGTLDGVSSLAGEVDIAGGRTLDFAMVLNELSPGVQGVATGDELAIALSKYPQLSPKDARDAAGLSAQLATAEVKTMEPFPYRAQARASGSVGPAGLPRADTSTGSIGPPPSTVPGSSVPGSSVPTPSSVGPTTSSP